MRSWGQSVGLLGTRFWQIYRKEGLMRTLLRGKPYKSTHEKAGYAEDVVRLVGTDCFGNRYYEDFMHSNKNTRRWVEYADYNKWFLIPKKTEPGWHGWLHYQYDDPPRVRTFILLITFRKTTSLSQHGAHTRPMCSRRIILMPIGILGTCKTPSAQRMCKLLFPTNLLERPQETGNTTRGSLPLAESNASARRSWSRSRQPLVSFTKS